MKYLYFLYIEKESIQSPVIHNDFFKIKKSLHNLPQPFNESYSYDTRGNRLTSLTNSYTYNDLNRLTSTTTHTYTYDADGNLTEEKNKITTETKKYFYNSESRLTGFEHYPTAASPADTIAAYKYDIYGRRLQKNVNGNITNFSWENDNLALELDVNYQPIRRYVYGLGKDDVEGYVEISEITGGMFDQSRQGWYSYIKDQVGTIYKVYSDNAKQIVDTRAYDTFGNLINQTGSSTGNLGFQGKYYDKESGLYYFYKRYYNPDNGRFINEDPIGFNGGLNMYGFVGNNPVQVTDPYGLDLEFIDPNEIKFYQEAAEGMYYFGKYYKNMKEANKQGVIADKYFHCMANCMAAKVGTGGFFISIIISWVREFTDEYIKGESASACNEDRAANKLGRYASKYMSCKDACNPLRPSKLSKKY